MDWNLTSAIIGNGGVPDSALFRFERQHVHGRPLAQHQPADAAQMLDSGRTS